MPKPKGGDLETGCICKSVKIFLQDRKYAGIRTVVRVLKQHEKRKITGMLRRLTVQIQVKGLLFLRLRALSAFKDSSNFTNTISLLIYGLWLRLSYGYHKEGSRFG